MPTDRPAGDASPSPVDRTHLSAGQSALLDSWLPGWTVTRDLSWPGQDATVWLVRAGDRRLVIKASHTTGNTIREVAAHRVLEGEPAGRVPVLRHASLTEQILVTDYLPGDLVQGSPAENDPDVYRQAGELLRRIQRPAGPSTTYVQNRLKTLQHKLGQATGLVEERLRIRAAAVAAQTVDEPVELVFTHGDFQPRNWIIDQGRVSLIDFGRADSRHWTSDLVRLRNQQLLGRPDLAEAFDQGLDRPLGGVDRRLLRLETLQQAVGTVVWAHQWDFPSFEEHGRTMLRRALVDDPGA